MILTARGYHNVLDAQSLESRKRVASHKGMTTYTESSCVDLAATLVVDALLLLDL